MRIALILLHVALGVAWLAGAVLWRWPAARTRGSELQAAQVSVLVALFCWGLPATARLMCSDTYNTFDGNLQQLTRTLTLTLTLTLILALTLALALALTLTRARPRRS